VPQTVKSKGSWKQEHFRLLTQTLQKFPYHFSNELPANEFHNLGEIQFNSIKVSKSNLANDIVFKEEKYGTSFNGNPYCSFSRFESFLVGRSCILLKTVIFKEKSGKKIL